jgi:hypothetical protein
MLLAAVTRLAGTTNISYLVDSLDDLAATGSDY